MSWVWKGLSCLVEGFWCPPNDEGGLWKVRAGLVERPSKVVPKELDTVRDRSGKPLRGGMSCACEGMATRDVGGRCVVSAGGRDEGDYIFNPFRLIYCVIIQISRPHHPAPTTHAGTPEDLTPCPLAWSNLMCET